MNVFPYMDGHRLAFSATFNEAPGIRPLFSRSVMGRMRLSTEAIGAINLSFTGVKSGSEIYIFDNTLTALAGVESASDPQTFSVPIYALGNALNSVRILIASLGYENIDLAFTLPQADATIPIQQRIDRNYKNPA